MNINPNCKLSLIDWLDWVTFATKDLILLFILIHVQQSPDSNYKPGGRLLNWCVPGEFEVSL